MSRPEACCQAQLASALSQLATVRINQGDYVEAESLLARAVQVGEPLWGPRDPRLATARAATGALRLAQQRYEEARGEFERALAIWRAAGREGRAESGAALNNLAQAYKLSGDYRKAEPLYKRAMASCARWLGTGHSTCLAVARNFADLLGSREICDERKICSLRRSAHAGASQGDDAAVAQARAQLSEITAARQARWTVTAKALRAR